MDYVEISGKVRKIGDETESEVFRINEGSAAKVVHNSLQNPGVARDRLKNEFDIAKDLNQNRISVPYPHGIFELDLFGNGNIYPCFVMQYIDGVNITQLRGRLHNLALRVVEKEAEKARKLGYVPSGDYQNNAMISRRSGRIYLIDFTMWDRNRFWN